MEFIQGRLRAAKEGGMIVEPSVLGSQLFLWANGRSDLDQTRFLTHEFNFEFDERISVAKGIMRIQPE